ncbi:phosphotransferase enzyme family protein [Paenibacillus sp. NPDC058177]|uniref:phosphotransferase enzyme family protein n=1 Tax=Paenibacillus sp. NPDC058177 TaxID=3346369 RepID=UPI0036DF49AD
MDNFFKYDTVQHRRSLLNKARMIVLSALMRYDIEWERIEFIQLSDTITYKIETKSTGHYLLRIHSDLLSKEQIQSELTLLQALNSGDDLTVPEGIASRDGSYVLDIEVAGEHRRPYYVTMMRWVEGSHVEGDFTDSLASKMGMLMGRLHEAAEKFDPPADFTRPVWGAGSFRSELAKLEQHYSVFLSEEAWKGYQAAAEKVCTQLEGMLSNDHNYGLIHGDLHSGNIVILEEEPFPIDFGRCGYGYYLYDMAGAMLGLWPKHRWMFIQGYESVRKLEEDYVRELECFFIMVMIGNYAHHASNPLETASLIEEQPYALSYIRKFLSGRSFLFEVVDPIS